MFTVRTKEDFLKLLKIYKKRALSERAVYCTKLFQEKMKNETEKLTYFKIFNEMLQNACTVKELQKEVLKAHKDASKHRDKCKNSGMTCIPPAVLSGLLLTLNKDIENYIIMTGNNDGHDLIGIKKSFENIEVKNDI